MAGMHSVSRGLWVPATELVASIDVILKPLSDLVGLSRSGFLKFRLLNDDLKKKSRCDSPPYSPRVHLALTDFRAIRTMLQDNHLLTAVSPLQTIECNPCVYSFFLSQRDTGTARITSTSTSPSHTAQARRPQGLIRYVDEAKRCMITGTRTMHMTSPHHRLLSTAISPRFFLTKASMTEGKKKDMGKMDLHTWTYVHDRIWAAVYQDICRNMPEHIKPYCETPIGETDLRFEGAELASLNLRKPDGIFFNRTTSQWTLVDYTRRSGNTRSALNRGENDKVKRYGPVVHGWTGVKDVQLYPLASLCNGDLAEDTWRKCMDRLGIDSKKQGVILSAEHIKPYCEGSCCCIL
jgi:hypothetical protein